jgi:hypothetical protein
LAATILDITDDITSDDYSIRHIKPRVQGWSHSQDQWTANMQFNIDADGSVKIGVWKQTGLLHYYDKTAISDSIISVLEDLVCQK